MHALLYVWNINEWIQLYVQHTILAFMIINILVDITYVCIWCRYDIVKLITYIMMLYLLLLINIGDHGLTYINLNRIMVKCRYV